MLAQAGTTQHNRPVNPVPVVVEPASLSMRETFGFDPDAEPYCSAKHVSLEATIAGVH